MKIVNKLHEVVSAHGNILRGDIEVSGKEFRVESDLAKTWVNIIDDSGSCEGFGVDEEGDVIAESGEFLTGDFQDADWSEFIKYLWAK